MLKVRRIVTATQPLGVPQKLFESADFITEAVKIDNYSGHWIKIEPDTVFVPPFTCGQVIDLFLGAQRVTVFTDRPPSIQSISPTFEIDGQVIISLYDEPLFPFPGLRINPPELQRIPFADPNLNGSGDIVQDIPSANAMMGFDYVLPLFWASAEGNAEANNQVQARQLLETFSASQVCAAGVNTNIAGIVPDPLHQRLMWAIISTGTTSELTVEYAGGSVPILRAFMSASVPVVVKFDENGLNTGGVAASRFRANHVVGGTVDMTVGFAKT